jgi:AraC-like DNA-binding protein
MMSILAFIGLKHPHLQEINSVIFGVVFSVKCLWMAYTCYKEYRNCTKELDNYYDQTPDIGWMKSVLIISYLLSVFTIVHFYIPETHFIYFPLLLICYVYLTLKIVDYLPEKISSIRHDNVHESIEPKQEAEKAKPATDLKAKLEGPVLKWIEEKKFIRPNLTIKDVASDIGTNHNYLSKYLNSVIGQTFTVWLHTLRIEESKLLLNDSAKMPIEEVGKRVGIDELYNFSRWFKVITDMTPYQFRKLHS